MIRRCCNEPCIRRCAPPHIHQCKCTLFDDPNETGSIGYDDQNAAIESESDFETEYSDEAASPTPFRGRSPVRRGTPPRTPHAMSTFTAEQCEVGLKRWRDFAQFGAIEDDHSRAGIPLPQRLRRPESVSKRTEPSDGGSQLTGGATTKSEGHREAEPGPAEEEPLIDLD